MVYDHFRPVYDQFTVGQQRDPRIQALIEYVDRYGMFDYLLNLVRSHNSVQYLRFRNEVTASPVPPIRIKHDTDELDIEQAIRLARKVVEVLEGQKRRYGSQFVPARFLLELDQRREDLARLETQLEKLRASRERIGSANTSVDYDMRPETHMEQSVTRRRRGAQSPHILDLLGKIERDDG